jgi:hypothetical protein
MSPVVVKVHVGVPPAVETGDPDKQGPVTSVVANPVPDTAITAPGCPEVVLSVMVGVACTLFIIAVSAATNSAIMRTSNVTAYRMRRNVPKSKHTSLKLID